MIKSLALVITVITALGCAKTVSGPYPPTYPPEPPYEPPRAFKLYIGNSSGFSKWQTFDLNLSFPLSIPKVDYPNAENHPYLTFTNGSKNCDYIYDGDKMSLTSPSCFLLGPIYVLVPPETAFYLKYYEVLPELD